MRKKVNFIARRPVKRLVCFRARGKKVCFKAKVPKRVKITFYSEKR